ncbi:phage major capsid protein [Niallia taxi]|uniref:phage major capsid protein n=1 Tax=Niallia taxi TaxID=2499688 RepID=UPI00254B3F23|nr:phage major capsid protein [Niallia taxi]MDK8641327.1 phage major capsid protein [Niallia taxi]
MNKKQLLAMQKRNKKRLTELRTKLEGNQVRADDLEAVQQEVTELAEEAQAIADALAEIGAGEGGEGEEEGSGSGEGQEGEEGRAGDPEEGDEEGEGEEENQRTAGITPEQRSAVMNNIATGLSTRGHKTAKTKEKEIRSAFANFVVGRISEHEARALGVETSNGSVTIPEVIASEIITYAQEENLLRKYGTRVRTKGNVKYPVLVKKAEANVVKKERHIGPNPIPETDIEFDEIYLSPVEFDALATISKKLLNMSGVNVETIVIEELKKAYVRKETNYMFNGDDTDNENPGALAKKAVPFYEKSGDVLYDTLVKMKNTPVTEVVKKGRWIINRAALTTIETMKTADGFPLLRPLTQAEGGIGYSLLGFPLDFTDNADGADATKPVFYFGDFSKFQIQDVIGSMEIQKLIEAFASTNRIGFQIYNLLDGQLVYSPHEPAVYRYEVGATAPSAG